MNYPVLNAVLSLLPDISTSQTEKLIQMAEDWDLERPDQWVHMDPQDFKGIIPRIEARKMINALREQYTPTERIEMPQVVPRLPTPPSDKDAQLPRPRMMNVNDTRHWTDKFELINLPPSVEKALKSSNIQPSIRKQFIRSLIDEIHVLEPAPLTRDLKIIASRIVSKYPNLGDKIDEETQLGNGHGGLTYSLVNRHDYTQRAPRMKKKRLLTSMDKPAPRKVKKADCYGCVNWQPDAPPEGETKESMELRRVELVNMHSRSRDIAEILKEQRYTFYTQRQEINKGSNAEEMLRRWPTLFTLAGALTHAEQLTGKKFRANVIDAYTNAAENYYDFIANYKNERTEEVIKQIEEAMEKRGDRTPLYAGLFVLVAVHFKEKHATILLQAKDIDGATDVTDLPVEPCLLYCGASPLTALRFMVAIDGVVVNHNVTTFPSALAMLFCMQYNMNAVYHSDVTATMDLFQRTFIKINPEEGSKSSSRHHTSGVHAKVEGFFRNLSSFIYSR